MGKRKARDFQIKIGELPTGPFNKISDVPGVRVGHYTVDTEDHKTGVTVIMPTKGNCYRCRPVASTSVINGFGKTAGLLQIDELGVLETPIALTNTLNVGLVHDALVEYVIQECKGNGLEPRSINPVVGECNDSALNQIQNRVIGFAEVKQAIEDACADFEEGDVGAGKGTTCFGLKGGIGSASRIITMDQREFTVGVLVQSNHGRLRDLLVGGRRMGEEILTLGLSKSVEEPEKGSIIIVVATDLPVSSRQLRRILNRASVGLIRTGSFLGHGSGDIVIGFSNANLIFDDDDADLIIQMVLNENRIEEAFRAVAEATEEAILNSMLAAGPVTGYKGEYRESLANYIRKPYPC